MRHQCEWLDGCPRRCTDDAISHIKFLDGSTYWYCAKHYDHVADKIKARMAAWPGARRTV